VHRARRRHYFFIADPPRVARRRRRASFASRVARAPASPPHRVGIARARIASIAVAARARRVGRLARVATRRRVASIETHRDGSWRA